MPTYTVRTSNVKLSSKRKKFIAKGITEAHTQITGANNYFAQVVFEENKTYSHYMGGKVVKDKQIFLYGQIRAGRTSKVKKKLIISLRNSIIKNSGIPKDNTWVYLLDLDPKQMIEYGEILPQSGKEADWFKSLNSLLQNKLKKIGK